MILKNKNLIFIFLMIVLMVIFINCSSSNDKENNNQNNINENGNLNNTNLNENGLEAKEKVLYEKFKESCEIFFDSDETNTIEIGQIGCIELEENFSTGFSWDLRIEKEEVIENTDYSSFYLAEDGIVGEPSMSIWKYKPLKKGISQITYKYYRSWEGEESTIDTKVFNIEVK